MTDDFFGDLLDANTAQQYIRQGSDAWDAIRVGRFTSSEFHKLIEPGKREMTPEELAARPKSGKGSKTTQIVDPSVLSPATETYIRIKVAEVLTGRPKPQSYAYPLVYGKEMEPEAVEYFERLTGLECFEVGFQPYTDHAGGSPDRLVGQDAGLEIKCPYTSDKQIDYLMMTDRYDLKNNYPDYYWQCVTLMLFTGRERWHFCTYDPRFKEDKHKMTHLIIEAKEVQAEFDRIHEVIEIAVKEKLALIQTLSK
jgi:hypothetical protein